MVVEWLMSAFTAVVVTVLGWVPTVEVPDFLTSAPAAFTTVGTYIGQTEAWIPWPFLGLVLAAWAVAMVTMVAIKGVRILASFLTLGGGSAA